MNWNNPRRFLAQTRYERQQVLKALEGDISRLRVHPTASGYGMFGQRLTHEQTSVDAMCALNGACKSLVESTVNYGDERLMRTEGIGFFTSEMLKNKKEDYHKFSKHFKWEQFNGHLDDIPILSPEDYDLIYKKFEEITMEPKVFEIGGALHYPNKKGQVYVKPEAFKNIGGTNTLTINGPAPGVANLLEFHLHPNHCRRGASSCGLGWPSTADLLNIVRRAWMGNKSHVIFAFEGCYTVFVKPEWKSGGEQAALEALKKIIKKIEKIVNEFIKEKRSYEDSVKLWLKSVNTDESPIHVLFAPLGNGPMIPVK